MLILMRRPGETIYLKYKDGTEIALTVIEVVGSMVRVGIEAPKSVAVHREEVFREIQEETQGQIRPGRSVANGQKSKSKSRWAAERRRRSPRSPSR